MEPNELDALEKGLDASPARLAAPSGWDPSSPRVRLALWRPWGQLAWTVMTIALLLNAWLQGWSTGSLALAFLLFVLPRRIEKARERSNELADAGEGERFTLYVRELQRRLSGYTWKSALYVVLSLLLLVPAFLSSRGWTAWVFIAVLSALAAWNVLWAKPRTARELTAIGMSLDETVRA